MCVAALAAGCRGGGAALGSPSATPGATGTAAPVATDVSPSPAASADPLLSTAVDPSAALEHVRKLAVEIGPRTAGTSAEIAARDYLQQTLASYGYDVRIESFTFDASAFLPARVDIAGPGGDPPRALPAVALRGSGRGVVTGRPLVRAGLGRPADFPPGGLGGAVALIERGQLTFGEKAANAVAAGASAVIIYNDRAGEFIGALPADPGIAVVGIEQAAGQQLASDIARGAVTASVVITPPEGTAYNVVARPKDGSGCRTVSGAHYDSVPVTGGADDNASGSAAVLELARVVAAKGETSGNCFALFSAEEFGLFGSQAFVASLSDGERSGLRAMVNLDLVGLDAPLTLIGDAAVVDVARSSAQRAGVSATAGELPQGTGSDHQSFQAAGIPAVMLSRDDTQIHTSSDGLDRISARALAEVVSVALATLESLRAV